MKTEDYSRAVRAMNDIRPEDKAAITIILKEDGGFFVSTVGDTNDVATLLDRFADYCDSVAEQMKGGKK